MSFARSVSVLILLAIVGVIGYQIGTTQAIGAAAPAVAPAVAPVGYWGGGLGWFFFPFGFFFWIFGIFLFFGLLRAAFGGGHWGGRGRYDRGSWRYDRIADIHRELHGQQPSDKSTGGPSGTGT